MTIDRLHAIGLGSNIEPRRRWLNTALVRLDALPSTHVVATSRVWQSKGWGRDDLDDFLNAVVIVRSALAPHAMLEHLRRIEDECGRQRTVKWGPRTLDLDLLATEDLEIHDPVLDVPHPWIARRPFVYLPWREVVHLYSPWQRLLSTPPPEAIAEEADSWPLQDQELPWGAQPMALDAAEWICRTEEETTRLATLIGGSLLPGSTVFLEGRMGAGKSVVARGIGRALGVSGPIQSPTYTLCRRYEDGRAPFEHWDLYRLGSPDELESSGYTPQAVDCVRVVEWASQFPHDAGRARLTVELKVEADDSRRVRVQSADGMLPFLLRAGASATQLTP